MRYTLIIISLFFFFGCYSRIEFTPYNYSVYTPGTSSDLIEIFAASPSAPFIELGYLQSHADSRFPLENESIFKKEAAKVGADAIINFSCTPDGIGWGPSFCQGTAIRYITRKKRS